jgi:hypothetical protein
LVLRVRGFTVLLIRATPRGARPPGRPPTQAPDWKKAIVTLSADDHIELFEGI